MSAEITSAHGIVSTHNSLEWHHRILGMLCTATIMSVLLNTTTAFAADSRANALRVHIKVLVTRTDTASEKSADTAAIQQFYAARDYAPAWLEFRHLADLARLSELAHSHGLNPSTYRLTELADYAGQLGTESRPADLAELDLRITATVAQLASHLRDGKIDLATTRLRVRSDASAAISPLLTDAANAESLRNHLDGLAPNTTLYRKLRWSLAWHRALLTQHIVHPYMPRGRVLQIGMRDPRVLLLRVRLGQTGPTADGQRYDDDISAAVAKFQQQHLLDADGMLGQQTIDALNVSVAERIDQLRVNLEWQRWAAMPEHDEYLLVNVAHYTLHKIERDQRTWSMRTQVGKRKRPTPTFKAEITAIMANPSWTVPPTIFREDILPKLQADPGYLQRKRMQIVDRSGRAIDSSTFNWQKTTAANFPYRLREGPGRTNALGRVKFLMPNPHLIYLHDTPSKRLFDRDARAFSSGCIRLQEPEKLAEFLIARQSGDGQARLKSALDGKRSRYIGLDQPIPIVVMYGTADLDADGELILARDLYGKDARVLAALDKNSEPENERIVIAARSEH
jgi:murein L,D-transpeptidase YcbB/YkuD